MLCVFLSNSSNTFPLMCSSLSLICSSLSYPYPSCVEIVQCTVLYCTCTFESGIYLFVGTDGMVWIQGSVYLRSICTHVWHSAIGGSIHVLLHVLLSVMKLRIITGN